jgi:hypothetical protein
VHAEGRFEDICATLRVVVAALDEAEVPYLLGGSMACWVHGAPPPVKDLDLALRPDDADRALNALEAAGLRPERPPEGWLVKAWRGDICVDLIFDPLGVDVTPELIEAAPIRGVLGLRLPVMALEDVIASKLLALDEHHLDFAYLLAITRPIREQVDWEDVRRRTQDSPYAAAFLVLLERLEVVPPTAPSGTRASASSPAAPTHHRQLRAP